MINPIVKEMLKYSKYNNLLQDIKLKTKDLSITGITDSAKAHLIYSLYNYSDNMPVVVCPNVSIAKKMIQDFKYYSNTEIVFFPAREITYYTYDSQSRDIENARVYAINKLVNKQECIIVTTVEAVMQKMLPISAYEGLGVTLKQNGEYSLEKLSELCSKMGYTRVELVEGQGQYSVRGGIIDIYACDEKGPVRIEFFGEEIDSIRSFDIDTQRSKQTLTEFELTVSNEFIISEKRLMDCIEKLENLTEDSNINSTLQKNISEDIERLKQGEVASIISKYFDLLIPDSVSILDYLGDKHVVYMDEVSKCIARSEAIIFENEETQKIMTEKNEIYPKFTYKNYNFDEISERYKSLPLVYLERINQGRVLHAKRKEYSFSCREVNFFRSAMDIFKSDIKRYIADKRKVVLIFPSLKRVEAIKNLLIDDGIPVKYIQDITMIGELEERKNIHYKWHNIFRFCL